MLSRIALAPVAALAMAGAASFCAAQTTSGPAEMTAQQDHARLMGMLGIAELRPGADGRASSPNAANSDETKARIYGDLPDALLMRDGRPVTTPEMWWKHRRPEIVEAFDREILGRVPNDVPPVKWEVVDEKNAAVAGVPVVMKHVVGHVDNSRCPSITVDIDLNVVTPATAKGKVPVVMELMFVFPRGAATRRGATTRPSAQPTGPTWQERVIAQGWGYATLDPKTVQADTGAGLTRGIIGLTNKGQPRRLDDWGALRAWAWGASRALDYLETDPAVDAKRVAIEGLSRYGKAALVAMAYDPRFAVGFIASSGAGGAKLYRRDFGEKLENLAGSGEYHWMAGNFLKYAGPLTPADLPVDSHELIALCAPRPVFISAGSGKVEGAWIDARGMFEAEVAAGPVYRLLGKKDLGTSQMPPEGTPLTEGDLAWRQHEGGHTAGPNWPTFLKWAGRYLQ